MRVVDRRCVSSFFTYTEMEDATRKCIKLNKEELHISCLTQSIISMIKSRRMRWAGRAVRNGGMSSYSISIGKKFREESNFKGLEADKRIK